MEVDGSGGLALWPKALPIERTVEMVSLASSPRVSATRGIKSTPAEWHSERWLDNFRRTPTSRACPMVEGCLSHGLLLEW